MVSNALQALNFPPHFSMKLYGLLSIPGLSLLNLPTAIKRRPGRPRGTGNNDTVQQRQQLLQNAGYVAGPSYTPFMSPGASTFAFPGSQQQLAAPSFVSSHQQPATPLFAASQQQVASPSFAAGQHQISSPSLTAGPQQISSPSFAVGQQQQVASPSLAASQQQAASPSFSGSQQQGASSSFNPYFNQSFF